MARWVDIVIAHRKRIIAAWIVLFLARRLRRREPRRPALATASACPARTPSAGSTCSRTAWTSAPTARSRWSRRASSAAAERAGGRGAPRARRAAAVEGGKRRAAAAAPSPTVVYVADLDAAREPGRVEADARRCAGRSADPGRRRPTCPAIPAINHDTQTIFNEDLGARRVDRDPDRAARDGVHVRHARRRSRAARLRARSRIPTTLGLRVDLRPLRWTWRST